MLDKKNKSRVRVQFDFSQEAVGRLDQLKDRTGSGSRAEVIRNALRVYECLVEMKQDYKVQLVEKGKKTLGGISLPL